MGANVDALKGIYAALGGDADDVASMTTIADVLNAIATVIPTALAAILPTIATPADDGKVLTAVSGEWKAAALPADTTPTI